MKKLLFPCYITAFTLALSWVVGSGCATKTDPGWVTLFDGKTLDGWTDRAGAEPGAGWVIENGALTRKTKAGDIWTQERFGDFVLALEFNTKGNSGVFIRTDNPKNNVQTGIEVQVERPGGPNKHSVGSIYDLVPPNENAAKDGWNQLTITARDNRIQVTLNGQDIVDMDLNQWTEPHVNPDNSRNKYRTALKDFKREGHIGFQDHGKEVAYRNVRIKPL